MLSSQEIAFFETFGYLVAKGLFSQKEMKIIQEESDSILDEDRGGEKFSGEGRQAVLGFVERRPFLSTLPSDERIFDTGTQIALVMIMNSDLTESKLRFT